MANILDKIPASQVLADGYGQCNTKATLLMALFRALELPCRLHGFTIHNSLQRGVVPELVYGTGIGANNYVTSAFVAQMIESLLEAGGNFIRNGSGAPMLAYVAAGRLVGYYEPYMHAWDCLAGYCLVKEAGGWYHPFPVDDGRLTKGAPVLAAAPGARDDLMKIASL